MVIKSKDKTRASQRKGALSNWKVELSMLCRYLDLTCSVRKLGKQSSSI